MEAALGGVWLLVIIFGFVLAIAWIILPFAMFGTKDLLRQQIANQKEIQRLLEKVLKELQAGRVAKPEEKWIAND